MTNLGNILKSRDVTLPKKVCIVKTMIFPVVIYGCDSWAMKKVEHQRTDVFELWCWRRLLRGPYSKEIKPVNPKGNQPWKFIGRTDAEAPILKPLDEKSQLTGKDPNRKDWGQEENWVTGDEMVDGITNSMDMRLSKLQEIVKDREAWSSADHGVTKSWIWLVTEKQNFQANHCYSLSVWKPSLNILLFLIYNWGPTLLVISLKCLSGWSIPLCSHLNCYKSLLAGLFYIVFFHLKFILTVVTNLSIM